MHSVQALMVLKALYEAYEDLTPAAHALACTPGCNVCCRGRVLLTTLEAVYLVQGLKASGRDELLLRTSRQDNWPGQKPSHTFNSWARSFLEDKPPASTGESPAQGEPCLFLEEKLCAAYDHRPLACRTMLSLEQCRPGGEALQKPWWVTLATAFGQLVEQASLGGSYGPLGQVITFLNKSEDIAIGELLPCEPLPGIPAPPQHQKPLEAAMIKIFAKPVSGRPLGHWLQDLRERG